MWIAREWGLMADPLAVFSFSFFVDVGRNYYTFWEEFSGGKGKERETKELIIVFYLIQLPLRFLHKSLDKYMIETHL